MSAEVLQPEIVKNEIETIVESAGLEKKSESTLLENFTPLFEQARQWKEKASSIVVTDESQKELMKEAREVRLELKKIRIDADKTRKALKEDALRYGKAVQGVYNVIDYLIKPLEKHLEDQEKFAAIQEAKRKEELKEKRMIELTPYQEYVPVNIDLSEMTEEDYQKLFNGAKFQHEARIEAERKAEEERIAREKAEAEERERIRIENERLKKEAEERERKAEEERKNAVAEKKAIEEKARKEREERERIEAEKRALEEKERKRIAEEKAKKEAEEQARLDAERKVAAAPDIEKIQFFVAELQSIEAPNCSTDEAVDMISDALIQIGQIAIELLNKAEALR